MTAAAGGGNKSEMLKASTTGVDNKGEMRTRIVKKTAELNRNKNRTLDQDRYRDRAPDLIPTDIPPILLSIFLLLY